MNSPHRHYHRLAWAAVLLALAVIVFGGFVRLSNAGLSCPDWPTCYGKATWPVAEHEVEAANAAFERAVEPHKAWREQFHRHIAALLGAFVLALALLAARKRPGGIASLLTAALLVALSIPAYMGVPGLLAPNHGLSLALFLAAELLLLAQAIRWSNADASRLATVLFMVIVFQAVLGMWTVIWLVKPVIVMAHLLGGLLTFSLLVWLAWATTPGSALVLAEAGRLRRLLWVGLGLLLVQIALGGWTSANYAALACGTDFPTCLGQWWPEQDWREGFVLWRGIGVDYEGGVLDGPARVAIQMAHRLFALLVVGHLAFLALRLIRTPGLVFWGTVLAVLLLAQVSLGISNIVAGLPLWVATAHNAGAALLLFTVVGLLARLRTPE
ncbi:COX15/CtaA family protein [Arenimonas fontis]|uniref:Heme A synthase n=1 Tax=Arenimonas fontis TaxID=2608255 RepID=A0A5B2Z716_9GAMM|nr:COX15/CtaA family protein [Arenimonas fontis]KAA2283986.1 heme A synthase [Arenimonas fontis]